MLELLKVPPPPTSPPPTRYNTGNTERGTLAGAEAGGGGAVVHHEGHAARVHVRVERVHGLTGKEGGGGGGVLITRGSCGLRECDFCQWDSESTHDRRNIFMSEDWKASCSPHPPLPSLSFCRTSMMDSLQISE